MMRSFVFCCSLMVQIWYIACSCKQYTISERKLQVHCGHFGSFFHHFGWPVKGRIRSKTPYIKFDMLLWSIPNLCREKSVSDQAYLEYILNL